MSSYDLLKGLSAVDEELLLPPRKYISLRTNVLLCFIAGHLASHFRTSYQILNVVVYFATFFLLSGAVTLFLNRKRKKYVLIDEKGA